ncbi:MAG: hypothetical protein H7Y43_17650, partial [Akkermansiaceae bacterium]|nr:hypothetical protein [Verrucomicrobiales bacterium]
MKDRKTRQAAAGPVNEIPAAKGEITVLHVDDDANDTALMQAASRKA